LVNPLEVGLRKVGLFLHFRISASGAQNNERRHPGVATSS
jgi:hypothetical protein